MITSILISIFILALPFILGPLRKGIFHFLASLILLIFYLGLVWSQYYTFVYSGQPSFIPLRLDIIFGLLIFVPIFSSIICYFSEKESVNNESENFYDERLFYKYGYLIRTDVIPLAIGQNNDNQNIVGELYQYLAKRLVEKFQKDPLFQNEEITVTDSKNKTDARYFIRLSFSTIRKSSFFFFINLKQIGEQVAVNNLQYVKSRHQWYHVLLFIMTSPFHYWSWIYHRIGNKYSIDSYLGGYYYGNSFDVIDLEAYDKSSTFIVLRSIEEFAEEKGLLTEELKQLIVNNINNTQNINIEKSKGVSIGKLKISSSSLK